MKIGSVERLDPLLDSIIASNAKAEGNLVLCQHGNRQMAKMDAPLDKPEVKYITICK